jgi:hypothetical protein
MKGRYWKDKGVKTEFIPYTGINRRQSPRRLTRIPHLPVFCPVQREYVAIGFYWWRILVYRFASPNPNSPRPRIMGINHSTSILRRFSRYYHLYWGINGRPV